MKFIDYEDLKPIYGIKASKTTIWRHVRDGRFPKPKRMGYRNVWTNEQIEAHQAALINAPDAEFPPAPRRRLRVAQSGA